MLIFDRMILHYLLDFKSPVQIIWRSALIVRSLRGLELPRTMGVTLHLQPTVSLALPALKI